MGSKTGYSVGKEEKKKWKLGGVDQDRGRRQRSWAVHSHWERAPKRHASTW